MKAKTIDEFKKELQELRQNNICLEESYKYDTAKDKMYK